MLINTPVDFFFKYSPSEITIPTHQTELKEIILDPQFQVEERVKKSLESNAQFEEDIVSVFERFDVMSNKIIKIILKNYKATLSQKLKNESEDFYVQANVFYKKYTGREDDYYEFFFEDFIIVFCSVIEHYSGLNIHLKFSLAEENKAILMFYATEEKQFENLAEFFDVELQLKPYAMIYHQEKTMNGVYSGNKGKDENVILNERLLSSSRNNYNNKSKQIEDYCIDSSIYWPPYYSFKMHLRDKYRHYKINDEYYNDDDNNDDDDNNQEQDEIKKKTEYDNNNQFKNEPDVIIDDEKTKINPQSSSSRLLLSSKFRNIDKLRLIMRIADYLIKFHYLSKRKIIDQIIFKRNNVSYESYFSSNYIQPNTLHLFDRKQNMKRMNFLRNYFGETMAFYFLWVETYLRWLIVPMLCGLFLKSISIFYNNNFRFSLAFYGTTISLDYYDVSLIFFGFFLSFWTSLFIKSWRQQEKFYAYLWGTENYERNNPLNEKFESDFKEELIFGYFCLKETRWKHTLKKYTSYLVLVLMIALICLFVLGEFHLKSKMIKGIESYDKNVSLVLAIVNGIQIKIMNFIYNTIAKKLNNWENHKTQRNKNYSYALKGILFEFVNNYASLLYIAFVKSSKGICQNNNCFNEIEMQLYTLFLITLGLYAVEIGIPLINQFRKKKHRSALSSDQEAIKIQSIDHLLLCDSGKTLIDDYKTLIILFGFVCLFSAAAPLTPLIVFLLLFIGRAIDYYKYSNLVRVDFLDEGKGIEIYNHVIKFIVFIGMVINVAILLFASPRATSETMKGLGFKSKMSAFCLAENIILALMIMCNWYVLPIWFKKIDVIKELYFSRLLSTRSETMKFTQKNKSLN